MNMDTTSDQGTSTIRLAHTRYRAIVVNAKSPKQGFYSHSEHPSNRFIPDCKIQDFSELLHNKL